MVSGFPSKMRLWLQTGMILIAGALYSLATPPFQVSDEFNHFLRVVQIASGGWIPEKTLNQGKPATGGTLPANLERAMTPFRNLPFHVNVKTSPRILEQADRDAGALSLDSPDRRFYPFPNTSLYSPAPYLSQSLGLKLGAASGFRVLESYYLARLFGILASTVMIACALALFRKNPRESWLIFALSFTPMFLTQMQSLSADGFTNAISFLVLALIARLLKEWDLRLYRCLLVAIPVLVLCKSAYFPIALTALVPLYKHRRGKDFGSRAVATGAVCFLPLAIWSWLSRDLYVPYQEVVTIPIDSKAQLHFILEHPFRYAGILIYSLLHRLPQFTGECIGRLGWLETMLSPVIRIYWFGMLCFFSLTRLDSEAVDPYKSCRLPFFAAMLASIAIIFTFLYLTWNALGASEIGGAQGRYFIPLSPLIALFFPFFIRFTNTSLHRKLTFAAIILCFLAQARALHTVHTRYWE